MLHPQNKGDIVNRREFCLSMGLVLTGSASVGIPESLYTTAKKKSFRAKKIFLQHWSNEIEYETASRQTEILRQKLIRLRKEYDSIIVFPDNRVTLSFFDRFKREANNIGLALFVPASSDFVFPKRVNSVQFLEVSAEEIIEMETIEPANVKTGGVLFSVPEERWLILFDSSRCLWTLFVCRNDNVIISSSITNVRFSRLTTARILDRLLTNGFDGFL
ncbi:MAG: hypothetical protein LBC20_11410 [Planctomycetaceae bacterium]|nr:hypothetical protein [Planctomycetaceae bacterium]